MARRRTALGLLCGLCAALSGCGSSRTASPICDPRALSLVARTLAVGSDQVAARRSVGNDGMPQCSFMTRLAGGGHFEVTVNVDTSPQPYAVLTRTIVEGQQVFSPQRLTPAPVAVMHLGLLASWFPAPSELMSTDGVRLIRTTVIWAGARQARKIELATRISRLYLGRSRPGLAKMYP